MLTKDDAKIIVKKVFGIEAAEISDEAVEKLSSMLSEDECLALSGKSSSKEDEAAALRKLRHPATSKKISELIK